MARTKGPGLAQPQSRRRGIFWGALLAAGAVALVAGSGALSTVRPRPLSLYDRTLQVAGEYRCPVCAGETVAASDAPEAVEIKQLVQGWLSQGLDQAQIRARLVRDYGVSVLERPPVSGVGALLWVLPAVVVGMALAGLGFAFYRWRRASAGAPATEVPAPTPKATSPSSVPAPSPEPWSRARQRYRQVTLAGGVALMVLAGALWLLDRSSSPRLAGGTVSGDVTSVTAELQQASSLTTSNPAAALALYDQVLSADPSQPEALTAEGWIYSEAGFLAKGLRLLDKAERADPAYAPAHFYRGLVLLDYGHQPAAAASELGWYMSHGPAPSLEPDATEARALALAELAGASGVSRSAK